MPWRTVRGVFSIRRGAEAVFASGRRYFEAINMHDVAEIIRSFAWPITILVVLFSLRAELRGFVSKLTDIISNAVSISVGAKGVEIKLREKISAANARVTALQAVQEQMAPSAARAKSRSKKGATQKESDGLPAELQQLVAEYVGLDIPDHSERVSRKNALAREMGDIVLANDVPREQLVQSGDESLFLAFAAAVTADPEAADVSRLIGISGNVKRLHVRYRLVVALTVLISRGLVKKADQPEVEAALNRFRSGADLPLNTAIQDAENLLKAVLAGEVSTEV
jgi:hypothetical protein